MVTDSCDIFSPLKSQNELFSLAKSFNLYVEISREHTPVWYGSNECLQIFKPRPTEFLKVIIRRKSKQTNTRYLQYVRDNSLVVKVTTN